MADEDCKQDDVLLLPQDYEAAHQYVQTLAGLTDVERDACTEIYANRHAELGPRAFRLSLGLEKPRHSWEQAVADQWKNPLSENEFRKRYEAVLREPPTEVLLQAYRDDLEQSLIHYSQVGSSVQRVIDEYQRYAHTRAATQEVTYHARECNRSSSLLKEQIISLGEWALECRVRHGWPDVEVKPFRSPTAIGLLNTVTNRVVHLWQECLNVEANAGSLLHLNDLAASRFLHRYLLKLPPARLLQTEILREVTLLKQDLRESGPPSIWMAGQTSVTVAPTESTNTEQNTPNTGRTGAKQPVLANWAFGYDAAKQKWWLYRPGPNGWWTNTEVEFTDGFQLQAMELFLENAGAVSVQDLVTLTLPASLVARDRRKQNSNLKSQLSRLRSVMRKAISSAGRFNAKEVGKVIVQKKDVVTLETQIGWVTFNDDAPDRPCLQFDRKR